MEAPSRRSNVQGTFLAVVAGIVVFMLASSPVHAQNQPPVAIIDRLDTIGPYLGTCIGRRAREQGLKHAGPREVTVRMTFKNDGTLIGEPARTFSMPDADQKEQKLFLADFMNVLKSCTPLPFSKELGGAIAGRPYSFRYKLQSRPTQPKQDLRA
jgi:hypothetical protein